MGKAITINEERVFADFERLSKKRKKELADFVSYLKVKRSLKQLGRLSTTTIFLKVSSKATRTSVRVE